MAKKQDPMTKKKRGDKVMWQERELKEKKGKKEWVTMNVHMLYFLHS
jgi:hypothetical protein